MRRKKKRAAKPNPPKVDLGPLPPETVECIASALSAVMTTLLETVGPRERDPGLTWYERRKIRQLREAVERLRGPQKAPQASEALTSETP